MSLYIKQTDDETKLLLEQYKDFTIWDLILSRFYPHNYQDILKEKNIEIIAHYPGFNVIEVKCLSEKIKELFRDVDWLLSVYPVIMCRVK